MALLDDGKLAATIAQALGGIMGSLTLSRTTEGAYDPDTGSVTPGGTETWAVRGMVEDVDAGTLLDNSVIRPGDRKATLLAHGLATTPTPGDHLAAGGRDHQVVSVSTDPASATFALIVR